MPLPDIDLDDRTFESLFQELRRRIPAYTPEWTDHNESDPGITLMQLFAWLAEMIVWRLNRVPAKNFLKFLELVGVPLTPPAPAVTELSFTLAKVPAGGPSFSVVPAGTQVALGATADGPPIVFETDAELTVVGVKLESVQSFDGARFTSYTDANALDAAPGFPALSATPQVNAALYLGFDAAFPAGRHRLTLHAGDPGVPVPVQGSATPPPVQGDGTASDSVSPPVEALWEYWAGDAAQWSRLAVQKDSTFALTRSGYVAFDAPDDAVARKIGLLTTPNDPARFWIRYRIQNVLGDGYETPPTLEGVRLNTVSATNAVTEREELLGASNGRPNQTFQLARYPVLPLAPGAVGIVAVDEGDGNGYVTWTEVVDFGGSGPADKHYTIARSTGVVAFGDGKRGKIPRWLSGNGSNRDEADQVNVKATSYRWGGGIRANSGADTITTLLAGVPLIDSVTNPRASYGGADEETVSHAQDRVPQTLRTADRAVTGDDFAFLATQTPGAQIARAQAFPLTNPSFRLSRSAADGMPKATVPIPGAVTVIVVPSSTLPKPMPTAGTLQLVANWLDRHRLLTCELYVNPPRYREVRIEAQVIADPTADLGVVHDAVRGRLLAYFHPLTGGADGKGWTFGETIYFSETYRHILGDGVTRIVTGTVKTYLDQLLQQPCTDIQLEPDELVFSIDHGIRVTYS